MQRLCASPLRVRLWCGAAVEAGLAVELRAGALCVQGGGPPLLAAPPGAAAPPQRAGKHAHASLLAAWKAGYVASAAVVACAGGYADVEVQLQLPAELWSSCRPVTHAALCSLAWHALRQAGRPLSLQSAAGDCGVVGCEEHAAAPRAPSLRGLLEELPLLHDVAASTELPPLLEDEPGRRASQGRFYALDSACLARILSHLDDVADLRIAARTCRALAAASLRCAPGLRCTLFAHQEDALQWMIGRERPGGLVCAPLALGGRVDDGALAFVAVGPDGPLLQSTFPHEGPPAPALASPDARGGFFCDEPGLGKTVSVLALVLRTRFHRAEPPPDKVAQGNAPRDWYDLVVPARRGVPEQRLRVWTSHATLVVVPDNLISHWKEQAALHAPQLHVVDKPTSVDAIFGIGLDRNGKPIPAADLVLTSFDAFSAGGFAGSSPLLQVRWLRVVLDEGHTIWSASITNRHQNLCALHAERRWVMTGTPAPDRAGTGLAEAAKTLLSLLHFVRDPQYGCGGAKGVWNAAVAAPIAQGRSAGVDRLRSSLRRLMARATKACLRDLPPCVRVCTRLDFTPAHAKAYNQLVLLTSRALLLADWDDEQCAESLLHRARASHARMAVSWVRQACSVVGVLSNNIDHSQVDEALAMLVDADSVAWRGIRPVSFADPRWAAPEEKRLHAVRGAMIRGGECEVCGDEVPVVLVTPCAHVVCVGCGRSSQFCCPLRSCALPFTMQHGRIPQDFVELQPAMIHSWQSDWHITRSSKVRYVLAAILDAHPGAAAAARARALRWRSVVTAAVAAVDAEHEAAQTAFQAVLDAHNNMWANAGVPPAPLPPGTRPPQQPDRQRHLATVAALRKAFDDDTPASTNAAAPPKFILYSPFPGHLQLFATHLAAAGVRFAWLVSTLGAAARQRSVAAFKFDSGVNVLLMDSTGVLGHDLSCASRVFLLEPVRDASEAEQVIARAHRLGCKSAVHVETLAMRGTAEEQLLRLCEEAASSADVASGGACGGAEDARLRLEAMQNRELLRALAFVRPAEGDVEGPPALSGDATARHIEAVLTAPAEHAKTLPPALPLALAERGGAGAASGSPRRLSAPQLGPVSPEQQAPPPRSQQALLS